MGLNETSHFVAFDLNCTRFVFFKSQSLIHLFLEVGCQISEIPPHLLADTN